MEEKYTRRGHTHGGDILTEEKTYKGDIHMEENTHGRNMHTERCTHGGTCTRKGYTHRENIHIEGIHTQRNLHRRRGHRHGEDIYTEGTYTEGTCTRRGSANEERSYTRRDIQTEEFTRMNIYSEEHRLATSLRTACRLLPLGWKISVRISAPGQRALCSNQFLKSSHLI